ncbi:hypothetical protein ACS0TY_027621 [Phlomoides rotata]
MMSSHGVIILFMICSIWSVEVHGKNNNFIITNFGGIKDGKTDNQQVFANAWKKACGTPGGTVSIPKGTFVVSSGEFEGPCKGSTHFRIDGTLMASHGGSGDHWLTFKKVDGLTLSGTGTIDGNGASAWSSCKSNKNCDNRPTSLKIANVKSALIQGIRLVNSKMFHLHIHESENVKVENVKITAPEDSPNTDGIHLSRSNNINILNSFIGTGDDCVSIGHGSRNVEVSGVFCGPGHGISIGSLGKYEEEEDVSGITVKDCTLRKTDNGLRIKTWAPSKSSIVVSNVTYTDIKLESVDNPIIIDQYYCPSGKCAHDGESSVKIQGLTYANVRGSSSEKTAVNIQCSKSKPCQDIDLVGVKINYNGQATMARCSAGDVKFQGTNQVPSRCNS